MSGDELRQQIVGALFGLDSGLYSAEEMSRHLLPVVERYAAQRAAEALRAAATVIGHPHPDESAAWNAGRASAAAVLGRSADALAPEGKP